eukprot:PhF_6_TR22226/c0_g1_i2/m.31389
MKVVVRRLVEKSGANCVTASPFGDCIYYSQGPSLYSWTITSSPRDLTNNRQKLTHDADITAISFLSAETICSSSGALFVAAVSTKHTLRIWDQRGTLTQQISLETILSRTKFKSATHPAVVHLAFHPGKLPYVALQYSDNQSILYDWREGKVLEKLASSFSALQGKAMFAVKTVDPSSVCVEDVYLLVGMQLRSISLNYTDGQYEISPPTPVLDMIFGTTAVFCNTIAFTPNGTHVFGSAQTSGIALFVSRFPLLDRKYMKRVYVEGCGITNVVTTSDNAGIAQRTDGTYLVCRWWWSDDGATGGISIIAELLEKHLGRVVPIDISENAKRLRHSPEVAYRRSTNVDLLFSFRTFALALCDEDVERSYYIPWELCEDVLLYLLCEMNDRHQITAKFEMLQENSLNGGLHYVVMKGKNDPVYFTS